MRIAQCRNTGGWLFPEVDARYIVALTVAVSGGESGLSTDVWPAITSETQVAQARTMTPIRLTVHEIKLLSDRRVIPWFNSARDNEVFDRMRGKAHLASDAGWVKGWSDSATWDFSGSGRHKTFASSSASPEAWRVLMTRHVKQYGLAVDVPFQKFIRTPANWLHFTAALCSATAVPHLIQTTQSLRTGTLRAMMTVGP